MSCASWRSRACPRCWLLLVRGGTGTASAQGDGLRLRQAPDGHNPAHIPWGPCPRGCQHVDGPEYVPVPAGGHRCDALAGNKPVTYRERGKFQLQDDGLRDDAYGRRCCGWHLLRHGGVLEARMTSAARPRRALAPRTSGDTGKTYALRVTRSAHGLVSRGPGQLLRVLGRWGGAPAP